MQFMIKKLNNKWWIFTILSGICSYLDPCFGMFSFVTVIILFFDIISFIIFKGHYKIFKKRLVDEAEQSKKIGKLFRKEVIFFKVLKTYTTIFIILAISVGGIASLEYRTIMAPFYLSVIKEQVILQILCLLLAIAAIVFSCILFWSYINVYKKKLTELEI